MKGLGQFLDPGQQRAWLDGETMPEDGERPEESLEQRFKYAARFEKLLQRPQADDVLDILRIYGATCLPIPRRTERFYWSVSCLPSTSDKPLIRVNASWMELFTLLPDPSTSLGTNDGLRARFILHLSDFTTDGSATPEHLDQALLDQCVARAEDVSHFHWKADTFGAKVRGAASIRAFLACPHALRAIRRFNLTHLNRGRNAYQASHCYQRRGCDVGRLNLAREAHRTLVKRLGQGDWAARDGFPVVGVEFAQHRRANQPGEQPDENSDANSELHRGAPARPSPGVTPL